MEITFTLSVSEIISIIIGLFGIGFMVGAFISYRMKKDFEDLD